MNQTEKVVQKQNLPKHKLKRSSRLEAGKFEFYTTIERRRSW